MISLTIPVFKGSVSTPGAVSKDYSVSEIRKLQKALRSIDPKLRTELLRNAKAVAKPVQQSIIQKIQSVTPPSGMTRGRLNWNASVDAKGKIHRATDVKINFSTSSSGKSDRTSLVRVRVASPAVTFADMAGRSNRFINAGYKGSGRTREYIWRAPNGELMKRTHAVNGQIEGVFKKLGTKASRFVWPAAEKSLPEARYQVDRILQHYIDLVNRKGI